MWQRDSEIDGNSRRIDAIFVHKARQHGGSSEHKQDQMLGYDTRRPWLQLMCHDRPPCLHQCSQHLPTAKKGHISHKTRTEKLEAVPPCGLRPDRINQPPVHVCIQCITAAESFGRQLHDVLEKSSHLRMNLPKKSQNSPRTQGNRR